MLQNTQIHFPDHKQTFWQLTCIQAGPLGLPVFSLGDFLAKQYGIGIAICSVILANLSLWLISIIIISMALQTRSNAIENVRNYLGRSTTLLARALLFVYFFCAFSTQIENTLPTLKNYLQIDGTFLGLVFGLISAILASGGIRWIKWTTAISFPFLCGYYFYALLHSNTPSTSIAHFGISGTAVITATLGGFPFVLNSPTFFRHSRSRADSYLALTLIMCLVSLFQISSIWLQFTPTDNLLLQITTAGFIIWMLLFINVLNIYFVSASWEGVLPWLHGAKGFLLIGCLGTIVYALPSLGLLLPVRNLINGYLASQGAVLCIAFLIHFLVGYKPHSKGKHINAFCWLMGCVITTLWFLKDPTNATEPMLAGVVASIISFLGVLFIDENLWSIRTLWKKP